MKMIRTNLFPGGKRRALTLSYDDGMESDIRLVGLLNQYGIKGTFNLNCNNLGKKYYIKKENVAEIYKGHELAVHTLNHIFPTQVPDCALRSEILEDKESLEELCGYPVRGMAYPFGDFSEHVVQMAKCCDIEYSRTVFSTGRFNIPEEFMKWNPTAHHNENITELWNDFMQKEFAEQELFYLWGHSFEFDREDNWNIIEEFCKLVGNRSDVWYATNIQIKEYLEAVKNLKFSTSGKCVYNPSFVDVWISVGLDPVCISGGHLLKI